MSEEEKVAAEEAIALMLRDSGFRQVKVEEMPRPPYLSALPADFRVFPADTLYYRVATHIGTLGLILNDATFFVFDLTMVGLKASALAPYMEGIQDPDSMLVGVEVYPDTLTEFREALEKARAEQKKKFG